MFQLVEKSDESLSASGCAEASLASEKDAAVATANPCLNSVSYSPFIFLKKTFENLHFFSGQQKNSLRKTNSELAWNFQ